MKNNYDKFKINIVQNEVPTSDKLILGGIAAVSFVIMTSQMLFPVNGEKPVYTTTAIIMEENEIVNKKERSFDRPKPFGGHFTLNSMSV